jgi:2'-5' RNA ligase
MEQRRSFNRNRGFNKGYRPTHENRPRRNPLPEGFSLFYIAINCPQDVEEKVHGYKEYLQKAYGCRAASKSPAHITLVPPFRAEDELAKDLADFVHTYNAGLVPVEIRMEGYGNFGDRVLFLDVEPSAPLTALEKDVMTEFTTHFPSIIFGMKPEFNPHVTLATRDIPQGKLEEAKAYFEANHPFHTSFDARELTLFKLENGWWKIAS